MRKCINPILKRGGILFYHHGYRIVKRCTDSVESTFESAGFNRFRIIFWDQGTSVQQKGDGPTPVGEFIYLLPRDNMATPRFYKEAAPKHFHTSLWHSKKHRSDIRPCVFPAFVQKCVRLISHV